ncbi:MAG: hypothetical protein ACK40G_12190 [Cytophagaceae bacterium]
MKRFLILIFLIFVSEFSYSSADTILVFVSNPGNKAYINTYKKWLNLSVGDFLRAEDSVYVDSYLGLLCSNGYAIEVNKTGKYLISKLLQTMVTKPSALQQQLIRTEIKDFILAMKSDPSLRSNPNNYDPWVPTVDNLKIYVMNPKDAETIADTLNITWLRGYYKGIYTISVYSIFEDVLFTAETDKNTYTINLSQISDSVFTYKVKIKTGYMSSDHFACRKTKPVKKQKVLSELKMLQELHDKKSALNYYLLARYFQGKDLLLEAKDNYIKAMEQAESIRFYPNVYQRFVSQYGPSAIER